MNQIQNKRGPALVDDSKYLAYKRDGDVLKKAILELPDKMAEYINNKALDDVTEFKRAAFLLYAYIDSGLMSHGYAADLLGVDKFDLIDFYGKYGIPYINEKDWDKYKDSEKKVSAYFAKHRRMRKNG